MQALRAMLIDGSWWSKGDIGLRTLLPAELAVQPNSLTYVGVLQVHGDLRRTSPPPRVDCTQPSAFPCASSSAAVPGSFCRLVKRQCCCVAHLLDSMLAASYG